VEPARAEKRTAQLTKTLAIADLLDRPVGTYSGGERRRLEIARALVSQPQVLFLDEPTVGLDPRIRHELLDVIADLRDRDEMTVLLTTHYLDEAQRLCDRVAIMHLGRIVALDTPAGLLAGLGTEILELRVDHDPAAALERLRAWNIAESSSFAVGSTLTLPLGGRTAAEVVAAIDEIGLAASGITTRPPTLDDVYLHFTGAPMAEAA
jgi:ABC-2 type transport system ATP-binding protein